MKNETFQKIKEQLSTAVKSGELNIERKQQLIETLNHAEMNNNSILDQNDSDFADDILSRSW